MKSAEIQSSLLLFFTYPSGHAPMTPDFTGLPLPINFLIFAGATAVIAFAGWRLAGQADQLADRTGWGEAIAGAVFLGASTSLPGIIASAVAASDGYAELAVSNALGGIAAQTAFLAIADITYKRANLEHAAASVPNIMQGTLLVVLLTIPLLASTGPPVSLLGIHPATPILFLIYVFGMRLVARSRTEPGWSPKITRETLVDVPDADFLHQRLAVLVARFALTAVIVGAAGWIVARNGIAIATKTGLSETAVGGIFVAVATSLPELATSIAAVRQGALTLAVGNIIGGNSFDTLFIAVADIAYRGGSIYHAISNHQLFLIALTILLTGILLMGLVRREKRGIANIGFESFFILLLYAGAVVFMFLTRNS